jgi:DNA-binding IclR family transcriptional regulator
MGRKILFTESDVLRHVPQSKPGSSVTEMHASAGMGLTTFRARIKSLVTSGVVVRVPPVEVGGTPRYHRP